MQNELAEIRREIENFRRQMAKGGAGTGAAHARFLAEAREVIGQRETDTDGRVEQEVAAPQSAGERISGPIEKGDRVFVPNLQATGEVLGVHLRNGAADEADVQVGNFRLRLQVRRLELRSKAQATPVNASKNAVTLQTSAKPGSDGNASATTELDLRGERVEAGLQRLEGYLDDAYLENLPWVRIIHGKGTGAMRDAVRAALQGHPLVSKYRPGALGEGDDGVTVASLMTDEG
jgi:DNA mismatch repair protein MutS2